MKKLLVLITAIAMAVSATACGSKPAASSAPAAASSKPAAPASSAAPAPTAAPAPSAAPSSAPASSAAPSSGSAEDEEMVYTLDYDAIAEWVEGGFIGSDEAGSPVVMAIDAENQNAIIIFGDNSDMTAASFVGAITYDETTGTITDEANGSSLTFGVKQIDATTIELDMGDLGKATVKGVSKDEVLSTIKIAIDNYKHVL